MKLKIYIDNPDMEPIVVDGGYNERYYLEHGVCDEKTSTWYPPHRIGKIVWVDNE